MWWCDLSQYFLSYLQSTVFLTIKLRNTDSTTLNKPTAIIPRTVFDMIKCLEDL